MNSFQKDANPTLQEQKEDENPFHAMLEAGCTQKRMSGFVRAAHSLANEGEVSLGNKGIDSN